MMDLLRLIQEGQMSAVRTTLRSRFFLFVGFEGAVARTEVFVHQCQCGGMFYIARSEVQRERRWGEGDGEE